MESEKKKRTASVTIKPAPKLPHSRGPRVWCIEGCGTKVSANIKICRKCTRKNKQKLAKVKARQNKTIRRYAREEKEGKP